MAGEVGKKLKKAFIWKSEGMKNDEMLLKLKQLELRCISNNLVACFRNSFTVVLSIIAAKADLS
ncbi:hypothetical protein BW716_33770 [[Flexibacter] sp. ATCC 35208]|nr:hypothetical protein BW716_33770 [[Flexibacter] sp. ATCC 35208]